jgi:hypothetical protein
MKSTSGLSRRVGEVVGPKITPDFAAPPIAADDRESKRPPEGPGAGALRRPD